MSGSAISGKPETSSQDKDATCDKTATEYAIASVEHRSARREGPGPGMSQKTCRSQVKQGARGQASGKRRNINVILNSFDCGVTVNDSGAGHP